ncbi:Rieske 2Fe-2S domain-containing protein [Roseomonas sp. OT10]|uniref:Rieske 2Fe-2S domain-containing protein n=1 Tax=Roseomonas cutis TaxID=2897332 RepID=UPI001E4D0021|nr:Rieske 2Fe-2S domain-containing protein [Roseomonas sp. OT10]UFN49176.1 Rieske 2Fe-2S domain-containing protein [Roseomonas sp. OT10]
MLTAEENELLCRIEGDAPMGQLMRRHWVPALLTEQLAEPDGKPVRVTLFGERLVAFRDSEGRIGLLGEFCPHRKASLAFGRNENCGLRCLYHGWKFDVDGNVTDMPSEPKESGFAERVKHKSYPTREAGGFVWAYMGPPELMPEFEAPAWAPTPDTRVAVVRIQLPCNWAQIMEGQIDSAHSSSLHSSDMKPARGEAQALETHWVRPSTDKNPRIQVQVTNYGMRYAAIRRPIMNAATHDYVRITCFVAPFAALIPPNASYNVASVIVPRDDTSSYFHFIAWNNTGGGIDTEAWRKFCVAQVGVDLDSDFRPVKRLAENDYLQDREAMRSGSFTGIPGIPNQDIAMWESMGPIADRTAERLGASDIAVIQFRRIMLDALARFQEGAEPIGLAAPHLAQAALRSYQGVVPKTENWRLLGTSKEEAAYLSGMEMEEDEREMAQAVA